MNQEFDTGIIEIYLTLHTQFRASTDDILIDPAMRGRYLNLARQRLGDVEERDALHRLLYLRKRGRLPRD